jgi:hypothetical protein
MPRRLWITGRHRVDGNHRLLGLPGTLRIHRTGKLRIHRPRNIRVARRIRPRNLGLYGRLRSRLLRTHRILRRGWHGIRDFRRIGGRVGSRPVHGVVKNLLQLVPLPRINDRGRVGVHTAGVKLISCWSGELVERDWQNLRGKRLYNHPYTVRGFST